MKISFIFIIQELVTRHSLVTLIFKYSSRMERLFCRQNYCAVTNLGNIKETCVFLSMSTD